MKDFRIYRVDQEPEISYYIVKQRFLRFFWGSPSSRDLYSDYTGSYTRYKSVENATKAIERVLVMQSYPKITRIT